MNTRSFQRGDVITALAPTLRRDGSTNWHAFETLVKYQRRQVNGIAVCATTGLGHQVRPDDRRKMIELALGLCEGTGCQVIVGTGADNTEHAVALTKEAFQIGAHMVLVMDCPGVGSFQNLEYHMAVAKVAGDGKVMTYANPARTAGTCMHPKHHAELMRRHANVAGVKDATGKVQFGLDILENCGPGCHHCGDDIAIWGCFVDRRQSVCAVSVASNAFPLLISNFTRSLADGRLEDAERIGKTAQPLLESITLTAETPIDGMNFTDVIKNPGTISLVLYFLGILREWDAPSPYHKVTEEAALSVRNLLEEMWRRDQTVFAKVEQFTGLTTINYLRNDAVINRLA